MAELSVPEQKAFYANILETETQESGVRLQAYLGYAVLFYYEGDFRKAREILEPFAISYQSYEYIPEMVTIFNLMGVASQCEGEYMLPQSDRKMGAYIYLNKSDIYVHMDQWDDMYASEFIDACQNVFDCSLEDDDYALVERVIRKMDSYMLKHPDENRVGLQVENMKYTYAKKIGDPQATIAALEQKVHYYERIVSLMEQQRADSMDEYLDTQSMCGMRI